MNLTKLLGILLLSLFPSALLLHAEDNLKPAKDGVVAGPVELATSPTPLSDSEKLLLLTVQNKINRLTAEIQRARNIILEKGPEIERSIQELQAMGRGLQAKHGAVGYDLDEQYQWVLTRAPAGPGTPPPTPTKDTSPDAADQPGKLPGRPPSQP